MKTLHPIVSGWVAALVAGVLVQVVATFGPWPQTLLDTAPMESIYDGVLLGAQIVFVCDAFSAMTSRRPYASALSEAAALAELRRHAGTQFSPVVVDAFLRAVAQEQVPAGLVQR